MGRSGAAELHRNLTGAETRQADRATEFVETADDFVLKFAGGHDDAEFASQPVCAGLGYLHGTNSAPKAHR